MVNFRKKFFGIVLLVMILAGCAQGGPEPVNIIFETDMGNDMDDAIALDVLHKLMDEGRVNVLAVSINKDGRSPVEFTDIMNTWYGHPDIPLATVRGGVECEDAVNYALAVTQMREPDGKPMFGRSIGDYDAIPEATELYRKILSRQKDNSVVIVSVGFSTNLIRLLDTPPDEYSRLGGRELVQKKVRLLVTVAGAMQNPELHEYNVVKDIPAAKAIFESWPTPVVNSPWELGIHVVYKGATLESVFGPDARHPMVQAYRSYMQMPYDRPLWDPTAVLYAAGDTSWFTASPYGRIEVTDEGSTIFHEDPAGDRRYLSVTPEQGAALLLHFEELIARPPLRKQK